VKDVRDWKIRVPTSLYCLTCHQQELSVSLDDGETFTLTISEALLGPSTHLSHECTDCHAGFSKQEHAVRDIQSKRAHSLAAYATCRECHPDKYELFEGSIHFKLAKRGHPVPALPRGNLRDLPGEPAWSGRRRQGASRCSSLL
jgi:hypothetical protein